MIERLVGRLLADVAAGVLHEHVVEAGLAHLQAGDLHPVAVEPPEQAGMAALALGTARLHALPDAA